MSHTTSEALSEAERYNPATQLYEALEEAILGLREALGGFPGDSMHVQQALDRLWEVEDLLDEWRAERERQ